VIRLTVRQAATATAIALLLFPAASRAQTPSADTASIHYKGITIQPVGYFAAEAVWRERDESADIGSSFNAIPFDGTTQSQLSEFRASARQSRLGLLVTGHVPAATLTGFWESDFLVAGTGSNSNESNSYALRLRQFWGQAAFNDGSTITAGQMWSLLTTNKQGIATRQEASPGVIDAQYAAGFDWARQWAIRFTQNIDNHAWLAFAVEAPQMTESSRGATNTTVLLGTAGGSQLNATANYSVDQAPDLLAKIAIEPGWGHYELKFLGRAFRDRIFDSLDAYGGTRNATSLGGGVGAAAIWPLGHAVDFGLSGLWGAGIGRYGTSQLPDVTLRPDGTIDPIHAAHALVSLETRPTHKLDLDAYAGLEYAARESSTNASGAGVGYGSPLNNDAGCETELYPTGTYVPASGTCNADTRVVYQGNIQAWYRFYRGPAGTFQWGLQYSYTVRDAWSGLNSVAPEAIDGMVFTSIRYILP
jgi:hypothetical protein